MNLIHKLRALLGFAAGFIVTGGAYASEADLKLPNFDIPVNFFGTEFSGASLLKWGLIIVALGIVFGWVEFLKIKRLPAHKTMLDVSHLIYETCKTYLLQQGRLLILLELLIGSAIFVYFFFLPEKALNILHPLKVTYDHTAGIGQNIRNDSSAFANFLQFPKIRKSKSKKTASFFTNSSMPISRRLLIPLVQA
jgi:hypothetical protein